MILLALGANLPSTVGAPCATLRTALRELSALAIVPQAASQFFVSPAWPDPSHPPFVNAVAALETALPPSALLETLHAIEAKYGRLREARNAPRTLDLDLLDYDGRVETGPPELPHPRLADRAFVLVPLAQVAPFWRHPVSGKRVGDLIAALPPHMRDLPVLHPNDQDGR